MRTIDRKRWIEWAWIGDTGQPLGSVSSEAFQIVIFARNCIKRAMRK